MFDDWISCDYCDGTGWITHCPDDLCQGGGENGCIHGDNEVCPECHGEGEIDIGGDDDLYADDVGGAKSYA